MFSITDTIYSTPGTAAGGSEKPSDNLGQADFLRLMTEQLKHQDPLKPLENSEFLGQLAQFSTVQGINAMQASLAGLSSAMIGDEIVRSASMVGHTVLVPAGKVTLDAADSSINGMVAAPGPGAVHFTITDASGEVVKTLQVQAEAAGEVGFSWDGTGTDGKPLPAGEYSIGASMAAGVDGETAPLSTYVEARVDSVSLGSDGLYLNLDALGTYPIAHVLRIR